MKKKIKTPFYIQLLKANNLTYFVIYLCVSAIIVCSIISSHPDNTKHLYRFYKVMSRHDWFIQLYCWIGILILFILLIIIIEICFIKITNKQYPLARKIKTKYIISNWTYSSKLLFNYWRYKKWTKEEYIEEQKNKISCKIENKNNNS